MMFSRRYDSDAEAWITAVEKADGQELEPGLRLAMNQLVLDLKANAMWEKSNNMSMVIKMGARTLAGALIDIRNPSVSWTNVNFVSGDYNRFTGLKGDGSTKYLNSTYGNAANSRNNQSMWTYVTAHNSAPNGEYMGADIGLSTGSGIVYNAPDDIDFYSRSATAGTHANANAVGLIGLSRTGSTQFNTRGAQTDEVQTPDSVDSDGSNVYEYFSNGGSNYSNHRSCAAAIMSAITLSTMETILNTFITAAQNAIAAVEVTDSDAIAWIGAVETADALALEGGVKVAMNQLVLDLKSNSIWTEIGTMNVWQGARTLAGSLIDIKTPASSWTNNNFVSGDYSRRNGLTGNASTKYLDSNRANNADPQNDFAMWVMVSAVHAGSTKIYCGCEGATGESRIRTNGATDVLHYSRNTASETDTGGHAVGLIGQSRSASGAFTARGSQADETETSTSQVPTSRGIYFFAQNNGAGATGHSEARLKAGCVGTAHSLLAAETCMDAFNTALVDSDLV